MISLNDITSFDVIVGAIMLFFVARGIWIGFMRQLAAFFALVGSYWLAGRYSGQIVPYADNLIDDPKIVFLCSFALLFFLSGFLFILAGKVLHRVMELSFLGWFDRFLGLLLGAFKGMVLASLLYMLLASTLSASNDLLKESVSSKYLYLGAEQLYQFIHDPQLQKNFLPKELAIPGKAKKETGEDKEPQVESEPLT